MNKPSDSRNVPDRELPDEVAEPPQDLPGNDSIPSPVGLHRERAVPERRSPHRVISTDSYYRLERRGFGGGFDEFAEGLEAGDEMDDSSGDAR